MPSYGRQGQISSILMICCLLCSCASTYRNPYARLKDGPPKNPIKVSQIPDAKPHYIPKSRYGNPPTYVVDGKRYYVLKNAAGYNRRGIASWYGTKFDGRLTSTREPYSMYGMTAASPTLPLPTFVRVTNLENGRQCVVKVNDRGPFAPNRIIDLSYAAAKKLGFMRKGTALVQVTALNMFRPDHVKPVVLSKNPQLFLQVGAFTHFTYAQKLQQKLARMIHKPVRINRAYWHGKPLYRVQVGPLVGVGESDALHIKLTRDGYHQLLTVVS